MHAQGCSEAGKLADGKRTSFIYALGRKRMRHGKSRSGEAGHGPRCAEEHAEKQHAARRTVC